MKAILQQELILQSMHDGSSENSTATTAGHVGARTLCYDITSKYFWPNMTKQAKALVRSCDQCQRKKTGSLAKVPTELHPVPIPYGRQWHQIGIDLMSIAPTEGYHYIFTAVCYFTKWVELVALKTKSAAEVGYTIWVLMLRHGAPEVIISDQGREFNNALSTELYQLSNTFHRVTSSYHPQSNGLVERVNRITTDYLRTGLENHNDWVLMLPCIQAAHNDKKHSSTGFPPFELMNIRSRRRPIEEARPRKELEHEGLTDREHESLCDFDDPAYQAQHIEEMKQAQAIFFQQATDNLRAAQKKMKRNFDKRYAGFQTLEIGDMVMKEDRRNADRKGGKMEDPWLGPYEVIDFDHYNGTYRVKNLRGTVLKRRIPGKQLKKYYDNMANKASIANSQEPMSQDAEFSGVQEERECEVEEPEEIAPKKKADPPVERLNLESKEDNTESHRERLREDKAATNRESYSERLKRETGMAHCSQPSFDILSSMSTQVLTTIEEDDESKAEEDDTLPDIPPTPSSPWRRDSWFESEEEIERKRKMKANRGRLSLSQQTKRKFSGVQNEEEKAPNPPAEKKYCLTQPPPIPRSSRLRARKAEFQHPDKLPLTDVQATELALHDSKVDTSGDGNKSMVGDFQEEKKSTEYTLKDDGVEFDFAVAVPHIPLFQPLSSETCFKICRELKLKVDKTLFYREKSFRQKGIGEAFSEAGPGAAVTVDGDGACFFRAVSWVLTGTEDNHDVIRRKICSFLMDPKNWWRMQPLVRSGKNGSAYVRNADMRNPKKWATEVEIFALAYMTGQDVWVYRSLGKGKGEWLPFRASGRSDVCTDTAFYFLLECSHYEPIVTL